MIRRIKCWYRSRLFHKLVMSHVLLLGLFLFLALMMGKHAFRAFARLLFQENFIRQSNLLFHDLNDELKQTQRAAAHARIAHRAILVRRKASPPTTRPASPRAAVRPPTARPSPVPGDRSRPSTSTHRHRAVPASRRAVPAQRRPAKKKLGASTATLAKTGPWRQWEPVLTRHSRSASRFLITLVSVLRADGTCLFETYPPTLMDMMQGRKWPRRYGLKRLLRAPHIKLAKATQGQCQGVEQLKSLPHGKVYQVVERTLFHNNAPYLLVRYHSLSPFRERPPPGAIVVPFIFVFALAMLLVFPVSRRITRSLQGLMETVQKIQGGDLTQEVAPQGSDEVGQLARAVENMRVSLLAYQEQRQELLSDVSHEIRTPLARVRTVAECVADGLMREDKPLTGAMEGICQQVDEIDQLLGDILDLARFGLSQANELQRTEFSLQELLHEMFRALRPAAEAEKKRLVLDVPQEKMVVQADRRRLRQVINNLVQNAVRHSPSGGQIQLSLDVDGPQRGAVGSTLSEGRCAWIFVSDEGPGVPEKDRVRIFERLVRLDPSRCRHTGGQGLGLAIVTQIVRAHGGDVGVDEAEGGGARFWVRLPMS